MLHDYGEFNNFVDRALAIMEEEINDESDKVEQKDKEACENIKTIRSELGSVHKELKINIELEIEKNYEESFYHFKPSGKTPTTI